MARAHQPMLAGGLASWRAPIGHSGRGAWWRTPIGRFWPGGLVARAHRRILAAGLGGARQWANSGRRAGWRVPISRCWPGG